MNSCVLRLLLIWTPNEAESICRKLGEMLRRPALHAFIIHCGTNLAWIAPPNTLTDPYTCFLPKLWPYLTFMTPTSKSKPYIIKLPKYTVLINWWIVYAILILCWNTPCFITLWGFTQHFYIADPYPILKRCWGIANIKTLLSYNLS